MNTLAEVIFMLYIERIGKMLGRMPYKEKFEMARDPSTPREIKLKLASEKDAQIKIALAHQCIDKEIIDLLIADPSPNVRFALINCTNTDHISSEHLENLAMDPKEFISNRAKELLAQRAEKKTNSFFFFAIKKIRAG